MSGSENDRDDRAYFYYKRACHRHMNEYITKVHKSVTPKNKLTCGNISNLSDKLIGWNFLMKHTDEKQKAEIAKYLDAVANT